MELNPFSPVVHSSIAQEYWSICENIKNRIPILIPIKQHLVIS